MVQKKKTAKRPVKKSMRQLSREIAALQEKLGRDTEFVNQWSAKSASQGEKIDEQIREIEGLRERVSVLEEIIKERNSIIFGVKRGVEVLKATRGAWKKAHGVFVDKIIEHR